MIFLEHIDLKKKSIKPKKEKRKPLLVFLLLMENKPLIALTISVISVSFAAILIVSCSAPPLSISFYRLFFTTLLLLPIFLFFPKYRKELRLLPPKSLFFMAFIGFILAIHFSLWITSLKLTSVSSSVILVTAHPILVGPLSYYLLNEPLSRRNISGIFLSFTGVIILVYGNYGFSLNSTDSLQGNLLAFFGGIAAGLYILGGRFLRKNISVITYAFVVYAVGSIVLFFITLISNSPFIGLSLRDLGIIALMAVISGIFGHTLYNWSLAHLRASVASVALLGEPIASSVFALIIPWIQQVPSIFTVIGGAIILSGIYLTVQKK